MKRIGSLTEEIKKSLKDKGAIGVGFATKERCAYQRRSQRFEETI